MHGREHGFGIEFVACGRKAIDSSRHRQAANTFYFPMLQIENSTLQKGGADIDSEETAHRYSSASGARFGTDIAATKIPPMAMHTARNSKQARSSKPASFMRPKIGEPTPPAMFALMLMKPIETAATDEVRLK